MSHVMVRPAYIYESGVLAAVHALCFSEEAWDAPAMAGLMALPGTFAFLAVDESAEEPLGCGLFRVAADCSEILTLGVRLEMRQRGIGQALLCAGAAAMAQAGAVSLFLEVAEDNLPARALYARAGFAGVGRRAGYYRRNNGAVAALVLEKKLAVS